jgi:hypothetical protein
VNCLAELAERRLGTLELAGIAEDDILQHARVALRAVANGRGGRQAAVRRAAAEFVLSRAYLPQLTDRQLLYEVRRRRVALNAGTQLGPRTP